MVYIAVILTVIALKLSKGINQIQLLNQTITDKLKTKYEIVNGMSITEAKKKYIRLKATIFEILEEASPIISNAIAKALGGKSTGTSYRDGR